MKTALCMIGIVFLTACGPSKEAISAASQRCEAFVSESLRAVTETKVFDIWEKNGAIVVEVGYKQAGEYRSAYSVRKCVYDEKKGVVSLPGMMDKEWDKK